MAIFRLAHLSDLHFGLPPNSGVVNNITRRATGDKNPSWFFSTHNTRVSDALLGKLRQDAIQNPDTAVDLYVISGDLGNTGRSTDLEEAAKFVASLEKSLSTDRQAPFIHLLPGNHDRYDAIGNALGPTFEQTFKRFWPHYYGEQRFWSSTTIATESEALCVLSFDFAFTKENQPTLDFKHRWGGGAYMPREHKALIIEATKTVNSAKPKPLVIWALHYPPVPLENKNLVLTGHDKLLELAKSLGVPLIIAGHTHDPEVRRSHGTPEVWIAGSATTSDRSYGNWFHYLDLEISKGKLVSAHRFNYAYRGTRFGAELSLDVYGENKKQLFSVEARPLTGRRTAPRLNYVQDNPGRD